MKCPDCGTEMKPLATSMFCPNDCDRKVTEHIELEKTEKIYFLDRLPAQGVGIGSLPPPVPSRPPDPLFGDAELDAWIDSVFDDGTD